MVIFGVQADLGNDEAGTDGHGNLLAFVGKRGTLHRAANTLAEHDGPFHVCLGGDDSLPLPAGPGPGDWAIPSADRSGPAFPASGSFAAARGWPLPVFGSVPARAAPAPG